MRRTEDPQLDSFGLKTWSRLSMSSTFQTRNYLDILVLGTRRNATQRSTLPLDFKSPGLGHYRNGPTTCIDFTTYAISLFARIVAPFFFITRDIPPPLLPIRLSHPCVVFVLFCLFVCCNYLIASGCGTCSSHLISPHSLCFVDTPVHSLTSYTTHCITGHAVSFYIYLTISRALLSFALISLLLVISCILALYQLEA